MKNLIRILNFHISKVIDDWKEPPYGLYKEPNLFSYVIKKSRFYLRKYQPKLNDIFVDYLAHSFFKKILTQPMSNLLQSFENINYILCFKHWAYFNKETKSLSKRLKNYFYHSNSGIKI